MKKSEAISMLKSLIANIEHNHVEIVSVRASLDDKLTPSLIISMLGEPKIGRIDN